jgi:hypothetical protein
LRVQYRAEQLVGEFGYIYKLLKLGENVNDLDLSYVKKMAKIPIDYVSELVLLLDAREFINNNNNNRFRIESMFQILVRLIRKCWPLKTFNNNCPTPSDGMHKQNSDARKKIIGRVAICKLKV